MKLDSARSDKVASVIFASLGIAMGVGGFMMDRLEIRQIHPASIPGLVPMFLGALLILLSVILFLNARNQADEETPDDSPPESTGAPSSQSETKFTATHRLLITAGLCVVFAFGLVGRIPFFAASALFIFCFATVFTWPTGGMRAAKIKSLLIAATIAIVASAAISLLFRYGFLVRLP
ncbi:MAG: tripartite tricarboxylate transporter TctB family protein [Roseibium sp.]